MPVPILTQVQVSEITALYDKGGVSQRELGERYGVDQTTVSRVLLGRSNNAMRRSRDLAAQGQKVCPDCGEQKLLGEFPRNRAGRRGYGSVCLLCNAARCRARHAANPAPYRERASRWSREHPEAVRRRSRIAASRRRALVREAFVEDIDPQVVFERDEGVCGICNEPVDREKFDVDHVVPLVLGGEHSYANVRLAHVACNRQRGRLAAVEAKGGNTVCQQHQAQPAL